MAKNQKQKPKTRTNRFDYMGSASDCETMKNAAACRKFGVPHECKVVSAHRTPKLMRNTPKPPKRGALGYYRWRGRSGALARNGGGANLRSGSRRFRFQAKPERSGFAAFNCAMPAGIPVGTLAIGNAGATNAALLPLRFCRIREKITREIRKFREENKKSVRKRFGIKP